MTQGLKFIQIIKELKLKMMCRGCFCDIIEWHNEEERVDFGLYRILNILCKNNNDKIAFAFTV